MTEHDVRKWLSLALLAGITLFSAVAYWTLDVNDAVLGYAAIALLSGTLLPFLIGRPLDKEWVDFVYYIAAGCVVAAVYISTEFDKVASSLAREMSAVQSAVRDGTDLIEDLRAIIASPDLPVVKASQANQKGQRVLTQYALENCAPKAGDQIPDWSYGGQLDDFDRLQQETEKRQRERNCAKAKILAATINEAVAEEDDLIRMRKVDEAYKNIGLPFLPEIQLRPGGNLYPLADVINMMADTQDQMDERQKKIGALHSDLEGILRRQGEVTKGVSGQVTALNAFVKEYWPFIAILLLSLKLARVNYVSKARHLFRPLPKDAGQGSASGKGPGGAEGG